MFTQNIYNEFRLLSRNYWFIALSIIFISLCLFAGFNGLKLYESRNADLKQAIENQIVLKLQVMEIALAVEKGENPENIYRLSPMNMAIATGRLTVMPVDKLSTLAIGQSDLYTHQIKISSSDDPSTLTFTDLNNPIQLLFGNFDLVFVLTYLIPLIIIAFTYNLQSQELESGRLKLIASNPINPKIWLLQRYLIRFLSLCFILSIALIITIALLGITINDRLLGMILVKFAYLSFWFAVSFAVNVFGTSSGKNAIVLLSLWIIFVLVIPAIINQTANTLYPTPSRVALLDEIRQTKKELGKKQDKVLDEYLRNHPELMRNEEGENRFVYWQRFFASQEMAEKALAPLTNEFDSQLANRQQWVKIGRFLSPAILFQTSFTELAGTSATHYTHFKNAVTEFSKHWREYFMPMVFANRILNMDDLETLPAFEYKPIFDTKMITINVAALGVLTLLCLFIGFKQDDAFSIMKGAGGFLKDFYQEKGWIL